MRLTCFAVVLDQGVMKGEGWLTDTDGTELVRKIEND